LDSNASEEIKFIEASSVEFSGSEEPPGGGEAGESRGEEKREEKEERGSGAAGFGLVDEEVCRNFLKVMFNLPSVFLGKHLQRSDEHLDPVVQPLLAYCKKKEINPFDWMPEVTVAAGLMGVGAGMYRDHRKHGKEEGKKNVDLSEEEDKVWR